MICILATEKISRVSCVSTFGRYIEFIAMDRMGKHANKMVLWLAFPFNWN